MEGDILASLGLTKRAADQAVLELVANIVGAAEEMAILTARFLDSWFDHVGLESRPTLPRPFLLELAAIIKLSQWQALGIADILGLELPPAALLLHSLLDGLFDEGKANAPLHPDLFKLIFNLECRRFSWSAPALIGSDVILERPSAEPLFLAVADMLWELRHSNQEVKHEGADWSAGTGLPAAQ